MTSPARFPARRLLKGVSIFLGVLVFGLLAAIVALSLANHRDPIEAGVLAFLMLLPGFFILKLIVDSFSMLEIDERGVRIRKWIGGADLGWDQIGSMRYWERVQYSAVEWFLELRSAEGKRLLRLKSTYEREAVACLLDYAKARNIRIDQ